MIAGTVVATVVTDGAGQASTTNAVSNAEGSTTLVARGAVLALVEDSQAFFISPPDPDVRLDLRCWAALVVLVGWLVVWFVGFVDPVVMEADGE